MTKTNILRIVAAIAVCLAVTTFGAQAQLGKSLKKLGNDMKNEVKKEVKSTKEKATSTVLEAAGVEATDETQSSSSGASAQTSTAQNPERDARYKRIFDNIEKAKAATDYDEILNSYASVINGRKGNLIDKIFSCSDPEMTKVDAEMKVLEAKLWKMYNDLKSKNKTPKYEPFEFQGCGQVLAEKEFIEKEKEKGLGFWSSNDIQPMPTQTYTLSSDVVKKIEEIYPRAPFYRDVEKAGGKVVKYVYTSNEWKDISYRESEWPYRDRKYRAIGFSILVKMPDEDFYRLYDNNGTFQQYYDSAGKLTDQITVSGGGGYYTKRKM